MDLPIQECSVTEGVWAAIYKMELKACIYAQIPWIGCLFSASKCPGLVHCPEVFVRHYRHQSCIAYRETVGTRCLLTNLNEFTVRTRIIRWQTFQELISRFCHVRNILPLFLPQQFPMSGFGASGVLKLCWKCPCDGMNPNIWLQATLRNSKTLNSSSVQAISMK